jgi:hypothetical protein
VQFGIVKTTPPHSYQPHRQKYRTWKKPTLAEPGTGNNAEYMDKLA